MIYEYFYNRLNAMAKEGTDISNVNVNNIVSDHNARTMVLDSITDMQAILTDLDIQKRFKESNYTNIVNFYVHVRFEDALKRVKIWNNMED